MMIDIMTWMISLAFTLPLLSLIILLLIFRLVVKNKKKSILWAVDISTIFFIISVHFHLLTIFEQSFLIFFILGLIILTIIVYFIDYNRSKAATIKKASIKVWRMSFLFFLASYFVLTVYGITSGMIKNAFF
jgi:hypothetical protein